MKVGYGSAVKIGPFDVYEPPVTAVHNTTMSLFLAPKLVLSGIKEKIESVTTHGNLDQS